MGLVRYAFAWGLDVMKELTGEIIILIGLIYFAIMGNIAGTLAVGFMLISMRMK